LLYVLFSPTDRGDMLFRNIGWLSPAYTLLYPWRRNSCFSSSLHCIGNQDYSWRWWQYVPAKHRLTLTRLHGVISQKTELSLMLYFSVVLHYILFTYFVSASRAPLHETQQDEIRT
jgi:hypothetical protein